MAVVGVGTAQSYEFGGVYQAVKTALAGLKLEVQGQTVLLKPNILSPHAPEESITTHPEVLRAVATLFLEWGAQVCVGESSGGFLVHKSQTQVALEKSGIAQVVEEMGLGWVNFDRTPLVEVKNTGVTEPSFYIPEALVQADLVVSLAKLKTHSLTLYTGAVKNLYGIIPGVKKMELHRDYPKIGEFSKLLAEIALAAKPGLAIMDGIVGLEGDGPGRTGRPRPVGVILASRELASLDAVAAEMIGYNPAQILHLVEASKLGLGPLSGVEVLGELPKINQYRLPRTARFHWLGGWGAGALAGLAMPYPEITEACRLCQICAKSCPKGAITTGPDRVIISKEDCIRCLCCQELCPYEAVKLGGSRLSRWMGRGRR